MDKHNKQYGGQDTKSTSTKITPDSTEPSDAIDFEEFAHFFEGEDITEEQAREFLQIYWSLALEIMSLGFGFHPVQQARESCGKDAITVDELPAAASDGVHLTHDYITGNFEQMAGPNSDQVEEDSKHDAI